MAYSTKAQIESAITALKVLELTDDEATGSETATTIARVTEAIRTADGEIDGYIQARYSVPVVAPVGSMTNVISIALAIYYLYRRRHGAFGIPEAIMEAYDKRISQLEKINKGILDLGVEPPPANSTKVAAQSAGPTRLFYGATSTAAGSLDEF